MKKTLAVCTAAMLLAAAAPAAPTIQMLNDSSPAYTFKVLEDGFAGYDAGTVMQTFCLEAKEYFNPGSTYYAVLNTAAVSGGMDWAGGVYGNGPLQPSGGSDLLDQRTAFLYTRFLEGDSRFTDEAKLQQAIHYIEAEGGTRNSYVTAAENAVVSGGEWFEMGIGNVRVMNLWSRFDGQVYSGYVQDQLILVSPVPAPGAVMLGSIGILFVGWLRRRKTI